MYNENTEEKAYKVEKEYDIIDERGNAVIALRQVSWFDKPSKLEIRKWRITPDGDERSDKGVPFLTEQGPHTLAEVLVENNFGDTNKILTSLSNRDDFDRNFKQVISRDKVKTVDEVSAFEEAVGSFAEVEDEVYDPKQLFNDL